MADKNTVNNENCGDLGEVYVNAEESGGLKGKYFATVGTYASGSMKAEENTIYYTQQKAERTAAVIAALTSDSSATMAASRFNEARLGQSVGAGADGFMNALGYGTSAQEAFQRKFAEASFQKNGEAVSGADLGLSEDQMRQLCTKGHVTLSDGVVSFGSDASIHDITRSYAQMVQEQERVASVMKAATTKEKADAVLQLQNRAVSYFRSQGEGWESFCDTKAEGHEMLSGETRSQYIARECQRRSEELSIEIQNLEAVQSRSIEAARETGLKGFCDPSRMGAQENYTAFVSKSCKDMEKELLNKIAECDKPDKKALLERQLESVREIKSRADDVLKKSMNMEGLQKTAKGPLHDGADGKGGQRKYGRRVIARNFFGDDMMRGYEFGKRVTMVTSASYRLASEGLTHLSVRNMEKSKWQSKTQELLSSDNAFANKYGEIRSKRADRLKAKDDRTKQLEEARKRGKREYRQKKQEFAKQDRIKRVDRRLQKEMDLDKRYLDLKSRSSSLTKQERRQLTSLEARNRRRLDAKKRSDMWTKRKGKLKDTWDGTRTGKVVNKSWGVVSGKLTAWKDRWKDRFAKGNAFADKVWKKLLNPISAAVTAVKKAFTGVIKTFILIPVGFILILCFFIAGVTDIIVLPFYFASSIPDVSTHLQAEMDNANYVQIIVNDTSERLSKTFLEVAKKDAQVYYINLEDDPAYASVFTSPDYDWKLGINEGHIKDIYEAETYGLGEGQRRVLSSPNDNLMQITSMMHARYMGEIGYENWNTARGYVYYMYVASHDRGEYSYEAEDPHTRLELYKSASLDLTPYVTVSGGVPTIDRPEEACENVYLHGYSSDKPGLLHDLQRNQGHLLSSTVGWLNKNLGTDFLTNTKENGLWISSKDGYPRDSKGECDNVQAVGSDALKPENLEAYLSDPNNNCPGLHTHTPVICMDEDCAKFDETTGLWITTKIEHDHSGGWTRYCDSSACEHTHDARCGARYMNVWNCGHFVDQSVQDHNCGPGYHYVAYKAWIGCNHRHTTECCSLENHHHTPTECMECGDAEGKATRPEHREHTAWRYANKVSAYTGCYDTIWICCGHCGGHITPQVDIVQNQTWEGLAQLDSFQTVRELTNTDLDESFLDETSGCRTLENWKAAWNNKMTNWWRPLVLSSGPVMWDSFWNSAKYKAAGAWDKFTGFISSFSSEAQAIEDTNNAEDIYGFEGWFVENASGKPVVNPDAIGLLNDLYGNIDDAFADGYEMWEAFDVTFPRGSGMPLTSDQIEQYMYYIKGHHPALGEARYAVLEEAMRGVGMFWYDLSGAGHENGRTNTYGRSECSGFVSGVLTRALGREFNNSAAGYAGLGTEGPRTPGDVIAHANGGEGYTGHVMIYVGYMEGGPDGDGEYVIDCSSTTGGSSMRKTNLTNYKRRYFPR